LRGADEAGELENGGGDEAKHGGGEFLRLCQVFE